jgi:hypothetical protein
MAIGGGGAPSSLETTVPLGAEEAIDALRRAGEVGHRAPGA